MGDDVWRPDWWTYPTECRKGHPWAPGRIICGWMPCDCPGAMRHPGRGHLWVRCRGDHDHCAETWYEPRHSPAGQQARLAAE